MTLRDELQHLDLMVVSGRPYGFEQSIFRRMLAALDAFDDLGLAITDAGYAWSPAMRDAYERATDGASERP